MARPKKKPYKTKTQQKTNRVLYPILEGTMDINKIVVGIIIGCTCGIVLVIAEILICAPLRRRREAISTFKDTFSALLIVFDENSIGFPLEAKDFLADIYSVQLKVMLRAKSILLRRGKKTALQSAWNEYYRYITNNYFESWLDENNRIDPTDTATATFKARTKERIENLISSI